MTQLDLRYLESFLTPGHAILVTDPAEASELASECDNPSDESAWGYISKRGRVLGVPMGRSDWAIYEGEITVDADLEWEPSGEPRIWRIHTTDRYAVDQDARRLFLAQSLRLDAVMRLAGWRERIVALIPEEVGLKEAKIWRTTTTGKVDGTHTYNVLDAIGTYAGYVHDLAMEFGTTDEAGLAQSHWTEEARQTIRQEGLLSNTVQAWLLREAAEAQLEQARHSLKFSLGAQARIQRMGGSSNSMSMAELARSLYTDRANLTRVAKTAEADTRIRRILDHATTGGRSPLAPSQD